MLREMLWRCSFDQCRHFLYLQMCLLSSHWWVFHLPPFEYDEGKNISTCQQLKFLPSEAEWNNGEDDYKHNPGRFSVHLQMGSLLS